MPGGQQKSALQEIGNESLHAFRGHVEGLASKDAAARSHLTVKTDRGTKTVEFDYELPKAQLYLLHGQLEQLARRVASSRGAELEQYLAAVVDEEDAEGRDNVLVAGADVESGEQVGAHGYIVRTGDDSPYLTEYTPWNPYEAGLQVARSQVPEESGMVAPSVEDYPTVQPVIDCQREAKAAVEQILDGLEEGDKVPLVVLSVGDQGFKLSAVMDWDSDQLEAVSASVIRRQQTRALSAALAVPDIDTDKLTRIRFQVYDQSDPRDIKALPPFFAHVDKSKGKPQFLGYMTEEAVEGAVEDIKRQLDEPDGRP